MSVPILFGGLADDHPPRRISRLTPRTESARVALDSLRISNPCFAGVEPRRPASPSLAEQVPALVQRDLEPSEPITVGVGHLPVRLTLDQLVFLARKFVDSAEDLRVVHGASLSSAPVPIGSCKLEKRRHGISIDHRNGTCSNTAPIEGSEYTPKASTIVPCHPLALSTAYTIDMSSGSEAPSNRRYPRITRSPGSLAYEFLDRFSQRGGLLSGRKDAIRGDDGGGERDRVVQHIVAGRPHGVRRVRFGRSGWNCRHGYHAVGGGDVCGYGMATPTTSATRVFIGPLSLLECATVGNDAASSLFDEKIDREVVGRQRLAFSG